MDDKLKIEDIHWLLDLIYKDRILRHMQPENISKPNLDPEIYWIEPKFFSREYDLLEDKGFWGDFVESLVNIKIKQDHKK